MKKLSEEQKDKLFAVLKARFEKNMSRHKDVKWDDVLKRLETNSAKLWSLDLMEETEGEPDVIGVDRSGAVIFCDCSAETPKGRRSYCYDHEALESRKEHKPNNSAVNNAQEMGIELLSEEDYKKLQELGEFDLKTSSWIVTPAEIRKLKGALFCDRRYNTVFTYHNGAESYYAARAFRGKIAI